MTRKIPESDMQLTKLAHEIESFVDIKLKGINEIYLIRKKLDLYLGLLCNTVYKSFPKENYTAIIVEIAKSIQEFLNLAEEDEDDNSV